VLFIALGLVIFGIAGLSLYFISSQEIAKKDQTTKMLVSDSQKITEAKKLVESCLFELGLDTIRRMGEQGGAVYKTQGGLMEDNDVLRLNYDGKITRVLYGIRNRDDLPGPPHYPYGNLKITLSTLMAKYPTVHFFGKNTLLPLCARHGPNAPDNPNSFFTCPVYSYGYSQLTIQNQIKADIMRRIPGCIEENLEKINAKSKGNRSVEVVFGDDNIMLYAAYPITINNKIEQQNYSVILPIRLKRIYQLAHKIVESDTFDVNFHKNFDYKELDDCNFGTNTTRCWDNGLRVYVLRNVYGNDDVLRIEDDRSSIKDKPYVFQIAISNRPPMLDYIYRAENNTLGKDIDIVGYSGKPLKIIPIGYDADEDDLIYNYSLWAETENSTYPTNTGCNNSHVSDRLYNVSSVCGAINTIGQPHRWTNSSVYKSPTNCGDEFVASRCGEIILNDKDRGIHEVRVEVRDGSGHLPDYQIVSVLINGTN